MSEAIGRYAFDVPPASIEQWQWEEAVNNLRRQAEEPALCTHWKTTGQRAIDATARAHIAEWLTLDAYQGASEPSVPIIDALVHRALQEESWDLYVVERHHRSSMAVRRLRDQRGARVRWIEGRTPPPVESTVALRLVHLDPPGLWASTLPLVFGDDVGSDELLPALLRSFGAHRISCWEEFMRGPGARILLEYALSHLRRRATRGERNPFDDHLRMLDRAFSGLESNLRANWHLSQDLITLDDGRVVWVEDITDSPHLLIFEEEKSFRRYRCLVDGGHGFSSERRRVPHCRLYRACPMQLSCVEHAMGALAGLRPTRDGLVRLERRDGQGLKVDPRPEDQRAALAACRLFGTSTRRRCAA